MSDDGGTPGLRAPTAEDWQADSPEFLRVEWRDRGDGPLLVQDVVVALRNVDLLYDFALVLLHPHYHEVSFTEASDGGLEFWQRVEPEHRLEVVALGHHSPLFFVAAIPLFAAGAAGIWAVTQAVEKVANFKLNRRVKRGTAAKVEAEARVAQLHAQLLEQEIQRRGAQQPMAQLRGRFETSRLEIVEAELVDENPAA